MSAARIGVFSLAAALLVVAPAPGQQPEVKDLSQCVGMLRKGPAAAREAAADAAPRFGAAAVSAIGALLVAQDTVDAETGFRRAAATRALWRIAAQASAPGATDREAVSLALLQLLARPAALDPIASDEVLHMLAVVATETPVIQRIAGYLDRAELAEAALFALRRIPGETAEQVLLQRLQQPGAVGRLQILHALAERDSPRLVAPMLAMLAGAPAEEALELQAALARTGDPRAEAALHDAMARGAAGGIDAWLVFLAARAAAPAPAESLAGHYRELLGAARPDVRAAAVRGLAKAAIAKDFQVIVAALGDRDAAVQREAQAALASWRGVDEQLLAAHRDAKAAVRGGVLQVLAVRQPAQALLLARNDVVDADAAVRRAALSVLADAGDPASVDMLFEAAGDRDASARAIAARGLAPFATERLAAGDRGGALKVLHRILAAGGEPDLMREAIAQVGRVASPSSLPSLQGLETDNRFREAVADARLQIAVAMPMTGKQQAIEVLQQVFELSTDRSRRHTALRHLQQRGVDAAATVRRHGVVQDWHVLGPWAKASSRQDLGEQPFGAGPDLAAGVRHGDAELRWQARHTDDPDGLIDLTVLKPHENVSAFAVRTFDWPADADLLLKLGSDDGAAVWVNGELAHANFVPRGVTVDEDTVKVHFKPGKNVVLVRVDQGGGDFGFCLRVCEATGKPVDWNRN